MNDKAFIITGTAPFSLGEAIVQAFARRFPNHPIFGIDLRRNETLLKVSQYHQIIFDIDPLNDLACGESYLDELHSTLTRALTLYGVSGISHLVQSAGIYDSGNFVTYENKTVQRLLGVNLFARVNLLHVILQLNLALGHDSAKSLAYVDIGAMHGLNATAGRSLYAAAKSFGLDFCASLQSGNEINRCIHFAPGPIDTHMLHRTHWVNRAGGSPMFFDEIYMHNLPEYENIFIFCKSESMRKAARVAAVDERILLLQLENYVAHRTVVMDSTVGIIAPGACAYGIIEIMSVPEQYAPGLYIAIASVDAGLNVSYFPFMQVNRSQLAPTMKFQFG